MTIVTQTLTHARVLVKKYLPDYKVLVHKPDFLDFLKSGGQDDADNTNGSTDVFAKTITLNPHLMEKIPLPVFWNDVIRHEIAHGIVSEKGEDPGEDGHGPDWKREALKIGVIEPGETPGKTMQALIRAYEQRNGLPSVFDSKNRIYRTSIKKVERTYSKHKKLCFIGLSIIYIIGMTMWKLDTTIGSLLTATTLLANAKVMELV